MSEEIEPPVIACMRVHDEPIFGSTKGMCRYCRDEVWISEATIETVKRHFLTLDGAWIVCLECFAKRPEFTDAEIQPMSDIQKKEILEHFTEKS